ncbi:MAG: hypothetical protein MK207_06805 [Saprospiraceae bacterium]|nr:hypothetical protein [Saprospiraceae bacterium]
MTKTTTLILAFYLLGSTQIICQNVGIGTATPTTKTQIVQTAGVTALQVDHSGATGNTILAFPSNTSNTSSAAWIFNNSFGRGLNIDMNVTTSTADGIRLEQDGNGEGIYIQHDNSGAGQFTNMTSATNNFSGLQINHAGTGYGTMLNMTNTGAGGGTAIYIDQDGTDPFSRGIEIDMDGNNTAIGNAIFHGGNGMGSYVGLTNPASSAMAQAISNDGLGRGLQVALGNTSNTDLGVSIFHSGTGIGLYSQTEGEAVYGISTGTNGGGGTFVVNNPAANTNTIGLFVVYDANAPGGGGGGGNAVEVQHNGTIGNAIDVFIGTPTTAAGPGNTTSEYSCISASHMASGTGTAGYKSAFQGSVNGGDPAIIAFNNGNEVGEAILGFANPNGLNDPAAIYGFSYEAANPGYGIGIRGVGGYYGVQGWQNGTNYAWCFGVQSTGDMTSTGAKPFTIDYPLDPENKALRHYSIESNEILNLYRGIVKLDANGMAIVELPEYFDAVNINPSYQLTAIGTPTQPYIAEEITNNQFSIAGAPNTKVSWTIHAQRNDPTIRYYDMNGKNYSNEVFEKPTKLKGKYYTPEAYGKPASMGIDYDPNFNNKLKRAKSIKQEAMHVDSKGKSSSSKVQRKNIMPDINAKEKASADFSETDFIENK